MTSDINVLSIGELNPYTYSLGITPFAPEKGVIVTNYGESGVIATCSAVVYESLVDRSIEELSQMTTESIASKLETSNVYAAAIKGRVMVTLKSHKEILGKSYEAVVGIVSDNKGSVFATGKRTLPPRIATKVSKVTQLRRSLPVGGLAMHKVRKEAVIHSTQSPSEAIIQYGTVMTSIHAASLEQDTRKKVVVISDSEHFRKYAGRTFLAGPKWWSTADYAEALDSATFLFVSGDSVKEWTKKDLMSASQKDVYQELTTTNPNFGLLPNALTPIIDANPNGIDLAIYFTEYVVEVLYLVQYLRDVMISGYPIRIGGLRFGKNGYNILRNTVWKLRSGLSSNLIKNVKVNTSNYRVKEMLYQIIDIFHETMIGVRVKNSKVHMHKVIGGTLTIEDVAKHLNVGMESLMVTPASGTSPPYMYNTGGQVTILSASPKRRAGAIAAVAHDPGYMVDENSVVYSIDGDLGMLLANA